MDTETMAMALLMDGIIGVMEDITDMDITTIAHGEITAGDGAEATTVATDIIVHGTMVMLGTTDMDTTDLITTTTITAITITEDTPTIEPEEELTVVLLQEHL